MVEKVAIFIDYDNVYVTLENYYDTKTVTYTTEIIKKIKEQYSKNQICIFKAFADFQKISPVLTDLQMSQVELRHVYSTNKDNPNRKNASDIALAIDVMKTLFNRPDINKIILVSSDSDMLPLINEAKYRGKEVDVVFSDYSAGKMLKQLVTSEQPSHQDEAIQDITIESLLGVDTFVEKDEGFFDSNILDYLNVINQQIISTFQRYKLGTTSKKDIREALFNSDLLVKNDVPILIDYLLEEEILLETPAPTIGYTKILINETWLTASGHGLNDPIIKESDYVQTGGRRR